MLQEADSNILLGRCLDPNIYINQIHTIINEHRLRGGMTEGAADFLSHGGEEINGSST